VIEDPGGTPVLAVHRLSPDVTSVIGSIRTTRSWDSIFPLAAALFVVDEAEPGLDDGSPNENILDKPRLRLWEWRMVALKLVVVVI